MTAQQVKSSRARPPPGELEALLHSMMTNHATLRATFVPLPHEAQVLQ